MRFVLLFLSLLPLSVHAADIEGAFGYELDQTIDIDLKRAAKDGRIFVTPPRQVSAFSKYYIRVVPSSRRISEVGASGQFSSFDACMSMHYRLKTSLKSKYHDKKDNILNALTDQITSRLAGTEWREDKYGSMMFKNKGRLITMNCNNRQLDIIYADEKLNTQAKKEMSTQRSQMMGLDSL